MLASRKYGQMGWHRDDMTPPRDDSNVIFGVVVVGLIVLLILVVSWLSGPSDFCIGACPGN